jgi:hypothetical protein
VGRLHRPWPPGRGQVAGGADGVDGPGPDAGATDHAGATDTTGSADAAAHDAADPAVAAVAVTAARRDEERAYGRDHG